MISKAFVRATRPNTNIALVLKQICSYLIVLIDSFALEKLNRSRTLIVQQLQALPLDGSTLGYPI